MISNGEQSGIECERRSFKAWRRCRSYGVVQAYRGLQGPAYEREVERGAERDGVWMGLGHPACGYVYPRYVGP
jgi:hypothetical protein